LKKAIELLKRALEIKLKYNDREQLATAYISLAEAYYSIKKDNDAAVNINKSLAIAKEENLVNYEEYCFKNTGIYL